MVDRTKQAIRPTGCERWIFCLLLLVSLTNEIAAISQPERKNLGWVHRYSSLPTRGPTQDQPMSKELDILLRIRGGADADEISMESSSSSSSLVMTKLRNIIRSVLEIGDRKAPILAKPLRSILETVGGILGVDLLPKKSKSSKKKKKNKKKSKSAKIDEPQAKETKKSKKVDGTTAKHLSENISSSNPNYRIQKELKAFMKDPPPNLSVKVGKNIRVWIVHMEGAKNTIYEGEKFKLRISFPKEYPTMPPSVYFLPPNIPKHEHVYTNGDICLSLLGKDWRPTMTGQSIAVSILSILSSAQSKSIPMDNAKHAQNKPGQYQQDWVYHDDNC